MSNKIINRSNTKFFRTQLRESLTVPEAAFWNLAKNKQIDGRKFRRQQSIGPYIVDFYCPSEHLAVELDGDVHFHAEAMEHDRVRDQFIKSCGLRVLRFENDFLYHRPDIVLERIRREFGWWLK